MNFRVYLPKQRYILSYVSQSALSAQRKGGGISKGGNPGSPLWLRAKGTHRTDCRLRKNKPDTKKAYYKRSDSDNHNYSFFNIHFSFLILLPAH